MEQLIIGKTVKGTYYVRPISWAGQWNKEGNLAYGNTLYESEKEADCKRYKNTKELLELISENQDLPIAPMVNGEVVAFEEDSREPIEPRYQLDRDSICYGCQYYKAIEDCDEAPEPDNVQCGGTCECIEPCFAGSQNRYQRN